MTDYKHSSSSMAAAKEVLLTRAAIERTEYANLLNGAHSSSTSWSGIISYGLLFLRISQFFRASTVLYKVSRAVKAIQLLSTFVTKFKI